MKIYIGVDPGASGGMAVLRESGAEAVAMPDTEFDIWDWFSTLRLTGDDIPFAVIEKVGGFIQGSPQPGSAMFKFGASYGGLRMALVAAGIPFEEVTPQAWQKALGIAKRKSNESKSQFKNRLKARAQQLFPDYKITLATCDALLLAEYCRRKRTGTL